MMDVKKDLSVITNYAKGKSPEELVQKSEKWGIKGEARWGGREYTLETIETIVNSSDPNQKIELSRYFFQHDGLYKKLCLYYTTLLKYSGILIPNPAFGHKLSDKAVSKRYFNGLEFLQRVPFKSMQQRFAQKALVEGAYYGVVTTSSKTKLVVIDLPAEWCRSRFRDGEGNDIIEFNVDYFNSVAFSDYKDQILDAFPKFIRQFYRRHKAGWVMIPAESGLYFSFSDDGIPLFLETIPSCVQYDDAVDTERERELEEIRKIIVQKVPHLTDGQLLFEPDEALEMHQGAVEMMKGNKNLSILTTYADVDAIISKTSADNVSNSLEKMLQNVYSEAGVSAQLFAPTGSQALGTSIQVDMSIMMILADKFAAAITKIVNALFANGSIFFTYKTLPISYYNQSDYITDAMKLAQSGYSFILPALAADLNQYELLNIKSLENDVLDMSTVLIPLSSSYTQSSTGGQPGRPELPDDQKSQKTIQNIEAIDNQGGTDE